jgi:alpha-mannosidase
MPKWVGELYLEFHRGTYTTMGRNKRYNRKSEFALMQCELLSVMNKLFTGGEYEGKIIEKSWELVLLNQFHDILPGSSIKQVYEDSWRDYEKVEADIGRVTQKAVGSLLSNINLEYDGIVVFNPTGFNRSETVEVGDIDNPEDLVICENDGTILPVQVPGDGNLIFTANNIPSMGYRTYTIKRGSFQKQNRLINNELKVDRYCMSNSLIDVKMNENSEIISIFDKEEGREVLKEGYRGNVLQAFEDKPVAHDAWDINIYYTEKMWEISNVESAMVIENGPVRACLEIKRKFLKSHIVQKIYLYINSKRIDVETVVDWKETHILLKTAFPVDIHANTAAYEIQFGNVERPTHWNTSWDYARFEVCAQKWVDFSEGNYGVSMLNDCKYGHDIKNNVIRQTLIKSPKWPNEESDREVHTFTYSIYPHKGGWEEAGTVKQAYFLNCPCLAFYRKQQRGNLPDSLGFVSINQPNVVLETVKKAEEDDNIVVRLYECENRRVKCRIDVFPQLFSVYECDIMENELCDIAMVNNGFYFEIKPYEIKTFKLLLQR